MQQAVVVLLVVLAFTAGWFARGVPGDDGRPDGVREHDEVTRAVRAALDAVDTGGPPEEVASVLAKHVDGLEVLEEERRRNGREATADALDDLLNALVGAQRALARGEPRSSGTVADAAAGARHAAQRIGGA